MKKRLKIGPGALVAAAFIGPGTVTTCSLAGARAGPTLLWALSFSIVATLILQEMSLRLGVVGRRGLAEAIREGFTSPLFGRAAIGLVLAAVTFGCAAYETGNLLGAALGLQGLLPLSPRLLVLGIGLLSAGLLLTGSYRMLEKILVATVLIMSLAFVTTLAITGFAVVDVFRGALLPSLRGGGDVYLVIALIGTTVVPYNLFLHASAARTRFTAGELGPARIDSAVSIVLGGVISAAVVLTAAGAFYTGPGTGTVLASASDMATQLEPLLGRAATLFFSVGLLAAGISSGLTAPMAAAWATAGIAGWEPTLRARRPKMVALAVVATGIVFGTAGIRPVPAIMIAQAANGILLPVVALFLLRAANDRSVLGERVNTARANVLGSLVVLIAAGLGVWALIRLAGLA